MLASGWAGCHWAGCHWQEYGAGSEESKATELALRGRILDQAQRFLLALVVHDPSRRAKCAQEVSRHGLSLGGERRQWLFDFLTAQPAPTAAGEGEGAAEAAREGVDGFPGASSSSPSPPAGAVAKRNGAGAGAGAGAAGVSNEAAMAAVDLASVSDGDGQGAGPAAASNQQEEGAVATAVAAGPSTGALEEEAGGDTLLAEVRAAAPSGYFALRGAGGGGGEGEGAEDALDWVFDKKEADRVARGTNTDLVLLEVVMVMLKEQVSAILCTAESSRVVSLVYDALLFFVASKRRPP